MIIILSKSTFNRQVIIGDAVEHLRNFAEKNVMFEFILYDLTAIPVTTKPIGGDDDDNDSSGDDVGAGIVIVNKSLDFH